MNSNQSTISQQGDIGRTVLWVSELPENITEADLENFFSEFKDSVVLVQINRFNRGNDTFAPRKLTATVIFKDHKRADEARTGLNLRKLRGKTIRIMWHEKDNSLRYNTNSNLFVKGIPEDVKPREFYELFLRYGDIISAKLCEDEEGNHNGYGYVSYYNSSSAEKAIEDLNGKESWGAKLEVAHFTKKNERQHQMLSSNKNLYIKNLPAKFTDADLKKLFEPYGSIVWAKVMVDNGRKFAILAYDSENAAVRAKESLNNHKFPGETESLYVDSLQKKSDRKKTLYNKIYENNFRLYSEFKNCNLHIRNIPHEVNEETLYEAFQKFGEIKSVKIPKYTLVTKEKNEFKEYPMSKGFGYVCFTSQENAKHALEEMNGKFLPGYEGFKRPLLIDFFQAKGERRQMLNSLQTKPQFPMMTPMMNPYGPGIPFGFQQNVPKNVQVVQPPIKKSPQTAQPQLKVEKSEDPDIKYMESLEDMSAKREYLGEFLFKKIVDHPLSQTYGLTIDNIGKITGMILGIEDLNEIVDITINYDHLTQRISEALSLLEGHNA